MSARTAALMVLSAVVSLAAAAPALAQVSTGRIDVAISDGTGAVLPGVAVDVSGPESHSAVTDSLGEAHFLNLAPGTYIFTAKAVGFSDYLNRNVTVTTGASVALNVSMIVAGVSTQVQVSIQSPLIDPTRMTTSSNVRLDELQSVPSSRDPWGVLQTVPGIVLDRVNVGGGESGQQPSYQAKGAAAADNTWNIDGIAVTDMAATGSSPTYYDFDMFQELQVTTGGADITSATPGVQLNMVLKSGSNRPHGSSRIYFENESLQANNMPADLAAVIGGTSGMGNRMHQFKDYGLELGGPLVKDRLWAWGAAGKTHVDLITLAGYHDRTELQDTSFKATGQTTRDIRANFTYFRGNKDKFGRGASPTHPPDATYDQHGPTPLYKGEINLVSRGTSFLSLKVARSSGGFSLTARGGADRNWIVNDAGIFESTIDSYVTSRPQSNVSFDGSTFRGHHELRYGLGWRKAEVTSTDAYPGNDIVSFHLGYPEMLALVTRDWAEQADARYVSGYIADTWTADRMTATLGLRWDRQAASLGAASVAASKALPALLPAVSAAPTDNAIVWNSLMPRAGVTYAVDKERTSVVRATYAMFASQMASGEADIASPIQNAGIYYAATDLNGNRAADTSELRLDLGDGGHYGFDPNHPGATINTIGSYTTPRTQEVQIGAEHELMSNFGVSATFTYRYLDHFDWRSGSLIGVNASDYTQTGTLSGTADPIGSYSTPYYALNPGAVPPGGGVIYEQRKGYHQRYLGFEGGAVKRLSNNWMARMGVSTNSHREYFDGPEALDDPTAAPGSPNRNGGLVVTEIAGGGKNNIFMVLPRYQVVATGMYQAMWGINLAGNWMLRQGYAEPYFKSAVSTGDPLSHLKSVLAVADVNDFRLPRVSSLDARIEKVLAFERGTLALDLDVFNVTNAATVLQRQYDLRLSGTTGFNQTLEIMNPRIVRLGIRASF